MTPHGPFRTRTFGRHLQGTINASALEWVQHMIEVRVPTFRRPDLLTRALRSLQGQTQQNWNAIVMDDSSLREGESVCRSLEDVRVHYAPNPVNLGRIRNINKAFQKQAFFAQSSYACVLEDDNWYDATFLEDNLRAIEMSQLPVVVRNYRVVDVYEDGTEVPNSVEPMRDLYGDRARPLSLHERVLESFFNFAVGNLSYFWSMQSAVDVAMESELFHVHAAETGRAISFSEDCQYEPVAMATFSRFLAKSHTPSGERRGDQTSARLARLSEIHFTRRLLYLWTRQLGQTVPMLLQIAAQRGESRALIVRLAEAGSWQALIRLRGYSNWLRTAKVLPLIARYGRLHARRRAINPQAMSHTFE